MAPDTEGPKAPVLFPVRSLSSSGLALGHFLPSQCEQPSLAAQKEIGFFPALQLLWFLLGAGNEVVEPGGRLVCRGWSLHPCSWQPTQDKGQKELPRRGYFMAICSFSKDSGGHPLGDLDYTTRKSSWKGRSQAELRQTGPNGSQTWTVSPPFCLRSPATAH